MSDRLSLAIREGRVILFVGSGVSASLGLPDWDGLVVHLADELGYDQAVFASLGDNMTLAEFYKLKMKSIGSLRSWMDRMWHRSDLDILKSEVHRLIVEIGFPLIYTTNYDRWLERAFEAEGKRVKKIVSVTDIASRNAECDVEIVKLHGDFDDDSSIVLSESDYFERLDFNSPLDIKFRSDALGKSILFIGYSIRDLNVRLLLHKMWRMWEGTGCEAERPVSYVFLGRPNAVQEEVLSRWGVRALVEDVDDPSKGLEQFLKRLKEGKVGAAGEPP